MSNISQTKKDLKKKLSFNDYGISAQQQNPIPEDHNTSKPLELSTLEPVQQQIAIPVQKQTDLPVSNKESMPAHKQENITAHLQTVSAVQHNDSNKVSLHDSAVVPASLQNSPTLQLNAINTVPADHQDANMAKQNDSTSASVNKHIVLPSSPNAINTAPVTHNDVTMVNQHSCVTLSHQMGHAGKPAEYYTGMPAQHCNCSKAFQDNTNPKIKATYYLSQEDNQALIDIYIKRLQSKSKTDKSALIAEAINLLYQKEMR